MSLIFGRKTDLHQGFTLVELIVAISILAIISSIAIPAYSSWLPDYKLKNAVRDLYSNMQHAKMLAIKHNKSCQIVFSTGTGSYEIEKPDGTTEKVVSLGDYDQSGEIIFGGGKATEGIGVPISDGVTYNHNKANFSERGFISGGYVYIANRKGSAYAIGSSVASVIVVKKWNETKGRWE
jgi:prepilin-type N-terminal cleavage/methylation domain-containing protein